MIRFRLAVAVLPLALAACATAPAPRTHVVPTAAVRPAAPDLEKDTADLRDALNGAYEIIVARASGATKPPVVDADALISMPVPDHRTVRGALNYFSTDLHDSIQTSLLRSARYRAMIEKVLDDYRLPRGLAYLPVIESAYLPTLTSRAGAHGMWQFMPDTAREYGLRVDWWMDERADPEKSTRAAAAYLRDLYSKFNDWSLSLAAYNCGPGRVSRALADTGSSTFWELVEQSALPKETRGYVPTFFATILIASDPPTYGFQLTETLATDDARVEVHGPVSLQYLAEVANLDPADLRDRNPQFRRGVLPPGKATVKLPMSVAPAIAQQAASLRDEDPYLSIATFTVRPGDTVKRLAKSLGVSPNDILAMNERHSISAGDSIYLPVKQREVSSLLAHRKEAAARFYTVSKGDTFYSIARNHGLTVEELYDLNQFRGNHILHPGDRVRVSTGASVTGGM